MASKKNVFLLILAICIFIGGEKFILSSEAKGSLFEEIEVRNYFLFYSYGSHELNFKGIKRSR